MECDFGINYKTVLGNNQSFVNQGRYMKWQRNYLSSHKGEHRRQGIMGIGVWIVKQSYGSFF